ncbi:NAD(P)/FAD-dependent oxidoreductase [Alteromonas sp. KUL49]|uniref:NAD(P)/FAD-dependent oxidoreductase n=1 Tax=Alteromonas sp. KUL49 TaxID=2480798 RepID=UPI00102EE4BD|nr:NAD(P)/FAD-dependent oxidoreductase [Alteromonas sp. KUL49]TAP39342.1 NAD(P)/FAD-dependent oxidoreductase [Alteromonas sp. KUL49]GEA12136.1 membrane protein [Alteromonas sp. KUL49]
MSVIKRDVIVIGAGAAGLFCAAQAGARGRNVEVLDHAKKIGRKILMSGGGRCNFTNMYAEPDNFLSNNPHFCKSALSRYTQWDFIGLVASYGIAYHEKTLGQLFCDDSAKDIVNLLESECAKADVTITTRCEILSVEKVASGFVVNTSLGMYECKSLVIATGGLSMPKLGASPFGYQIAEKFGLPVLPTRAALVPFTLHEKDKSVLAELSGIAVDVAASCNNTSFKEAMLFTHRGLSGPSMLQVSSYWTPGDEVEINLMPTQSASELIEDARTNNPDAQLATCLGKVFPKRMVQSFIELNGWRNVPVKQLSHAECSEIADTLQEWKIKPNGTEGYRTAEVTLGGVDTDALSSKTMMAKDVDGLYFIGEVVDVTGWLGGFNFQWAWSSGWAAGQVA